MAYWLHQFPEFYLQKLKRSEMSARLLYIVLFVTASIFFYASKCVTFFEIIKFTFKTKLILNFLNKLKKIKDPFVQLQPARSGYPLPGIHLTGRLPPDPPALLLGQGRRLCVRGINRLSITFYIFNWKIKLQKNLIKMWINNFFNF